MAKNAFRVVGSGGRNAKTTAEHKRAGTYRKDRHGGRVEVEWSGTPRPPAKLSKDGRWLWDLVVKNTPDHLVAKVDSAALFAMCRWWDVYRRLDNQLATAKAIDPQDLYAVSCAWKQVAAIAAQFGLSPAMRLRLKTVNAPGDGRPSLPDDPFDEMAQQRG